LLGLKKTICLGLLFTKKLVEKAFSAIMKMEKIDPPKIRTSMADIKVSNKGEWDIL
jgi:hypothetical protein